MALRDVFPFLNGSNSSAATDSILGHTAPNPDPGTVTPQINQPPRGGSGRANFSGLPEVDELNRRLIGPEGLRRFDEMYRTDPHIRRLILMAWAPIQAGTWTIEPYGGDQATDLDREVADAVWWALTDFMSPNLFQHLAEVGPLLLRSGFLPCEQIWTTTEYKKPQPLVKPSASPASSSTSPAPKQPALLDDTQTLTLPKKLDIRLPRSVWKWWQDDFGELTHIGQILPNRAEVIIPMSEVVYYRLAPEGDNWAGTSLLRHAYKPFMYKDKLERIDAIGQDRKAVGVPIVYPPTKADNETRGQVETILANLHTSEVAYVIMPGPKAGTQGTSGVAGDEWLVDVIQFDSSSGEGIQSSLTYHSTSIALSFAQDFMALGQHQVGAKATAEVQEDPYLTAVDALAQIGPLPPLNALVARIVELNWGDKVNGPPKLSVSLHDTASLSEIAAYLQALVTAEVITPDEELEEWARDTADMPPVNADIRKLRTEAQKMGLENAAKPPDPAPTMDANGNLIPAKPMPGAAGNKPTADAPKGNQPPAASANQKSKALDDGTPTAKWFERLLSQDKLQQAFDGARDHIEVSAAGPVRGAAARLAYTASNGQPFPADPPKDLVDALTAHYQNMYALGQQTVHDELGKQRKALRMLDDPGLDAGAGYGARWARARQRGEHSARNIMAKIRERVGRDTITGLKDPAPLQAGAEQAALGQLRMEALSNTAASINDGRADAASQASDVVGAYYTSVMDDRSCDPCITADDGTLLDPSDAVALGPPNPSCQGGDYCRCALVWVLSDDPAALAAVT